MNLLSPKGDYVINGRYLICAHGKFWPICVTTSLQTLKFSPGLNVKRYLPVDKGCGFKIYLIKKVSSIDIAAGSPSAAGLSICVTKG